MMKKLALSAVSLVALTTSVFAADLPSRKEPVIAPPPPPMWTGFHVGLNAGGTWANNSSLNATTWNVANGDGGSAADEIDAALFSGNFGGSGAAGFIGGGQVGYDYQFSGINGYGVIAGLEADIQGIAGSSGNGSRLIGAQTLSANLGYGIQGDAYTLANQQVSASLSYLGTVRGRLGVLVTPTLLVYGTGGLAYGNVNASVRNYAIGTVDIFQSGVRLNPPGPESFTYGTASYSNTQVGYTAGGGVEWMFMPNWSAKAEYLYYDLGKVSGTTYNVAYPLTGGGAPELSNITNYSARISGNIVRAGVNYHFNWGSAPVVAKF